MEQFPVGGPRDQVYAFLRQHGWIMSKWSDKHWTRHDNSELNLYGAGSQAKVIKDKITLYDGPLDGISNI